MDKIYLERRKKKNYTSYRLNKRIDIVINSLKEFIDNNKSSILDVGMADGQMLNNIVNHFGLKYAIGIDISKDAIRSTGQLNRIRVAQANFINLPFKDGIFDVVVASAVVEHIKDVNIALKEAFRVLRSGGLLCITLPNPVYDWFNSKLVTTYHVRRYSLKKIKKVLQDHGFEIVKAGHFMFCPFVKVIFSSHLERILKRLRLDFLLFNHITIGRKT